LSSLAPYTILSATITAPSAIVPVNESLPSVAGSSSTGPFPKKASELIAFAP